MILSFLSHQWKAFWRSRGAGRNLILRLSGGLGLLYLLVISCILGFYVKEMLLRLFPGKDPVTVFGSLILYYFAIDLLLRFLFQELPVMITRPYLLQNVRRRQLVGFLNLRSLFVYLNVLPLCIFLPFIFTTIPARFGYASASALAGCIILLTLFDHFLILYIKRKIIFNARWLIGFLGANALFVVLEYVHVLSLRTLSGDLFGNILHHPLLSLAFAGPPVFIYLVNRRYLYSHLYVEELSGQDKFRQGTEYGWLRQWGITGEMLGLEFRLIFRHRKPRTFLLLSFVVLIYGLCFSRLHHERPVLLGMLFFMCAVANGAFLSNYGALTFAWQSDHFDGLLASNIRLRDLVRSKFYLLSIIPTITLILGLPFGLLDHRLVPMLAVAWLYNIGCSVPLMIWLATYAYDPIDLSKGLGFNQQRMTPINTFYVVLLMAPPFLIYYPLSRIFQPWTGIAAIGVAGFISLLFRRWYIELIIKALSKRKYLILEGFRAK